MAPTKQTTEEHGVTVSTRQHRLCRVAAFLRSFSFLCFSLLGLGWALERWGPAKCIPVRATTKIKDGVSTVHPNSLRVSFLEQLEGISGRHYPNARHSECTGRSPAGPKGAATFSGGALGRREGWPWAHTKQVHQLGGRTGTVRWVQSVTCRL